MGYWYEKPGEIDEIVISSRVTISRNLERYNFPSMLSKEDAREVIYEVQSVLEDLGFESTLYPIKEMQLKHKQQLVERKIITSDLARKEDAAVIISKDKEITIVLNDKDHIRIECMVTGLKIGEVLDNIQQLEQSMQTKLEFAYDEKLGYLTACPANMGTGLEISVMLHIPALTACGYVGSLIASADELGLSIKGLYGESNNAIANIYIISNKVTLGLSEEDIAKMIISSAMRLVKDERESRKAYMLSSGRLELEDRILRSYGIARYAKIMTLGEFMALFSDIKLALSLGLIQNLTHAQMHRLLIMAQPAMLEREADRQLSKQETDIYRAFFVRGMLKI